VICANTMEHIDHCTGALAEFHRITEPGGFLMLHVPVGIGRPEQMRAKSYRIESDTNEHHHTWEHGTEVADWAQAAGYRMIGGAWSADDSAWRLSCLWLMERP
jgi:ubiquinone/menaquinone biosynthesis C-methylase UbiE